MRTWGKYVCEIYWALCFKVQDGLFMAKKGFAWFGVFEGEGGVFCGSFYGRLSFLPSPNYYVLFVSFYYMSFLYFLSAAFGPALFPFPFHTVTFIHYFILHHNFPINYKQCHRTSSAYYWELCDWQYSHLIFVINDVIWLRDKLREALHPTSFYKVRGVTLPLHRYNTATTTAR